jgi:hypothetical protein
MIVTTQKSTTPEPPKRNIVNLAARSQPLSDTVYFNPTAVKLFDEIEVYLELDLPYLSSPFQLSLI